MSAPVLHFTPRAELEPLANLEAFVALCRGSAVLGAKEQFEKNSWEIGYLKGQNKVNRVVFSSLEASRENKPEPSLPLPFLDFAKAAIVYLHDKRPVTSQAPRVAALRCLEAALRESGKGSRPTAVDEMVLDSAVEFAQQKVSPSVAYRTAGQLEYIAEFMRTKGFIRLRQRWAHGLSKPQEGGSRISKEALTARQEKLPSAATLRALGAIFHEAMEPSDVMVSSVTALMLCAPERINEVIRLRRNCLVEGDGEYRGKLGLRWSGSKGAEDTTKWLPTEMVSIARKAVANIIKVTTPAQKLAAWYSASPTKLYLHEDAVHLRDKRVLTSAEIGLILWGDETASTVANYWAKSTAKLPAQSLGEHRIGYLFEDVERAVVAMLPETFPYVPGAPGLRCSDSMAVMRTNEMHSAKATYLCMFSCVDYGVITNHFGAREGRISIFKRFGYTEDDGSPIELRSHSLRHYLNMLAQMGGLSSTEIAIFSGRKDVRQNRAYDHMSSDEVQAPISQALKEGFTSELEPVFSAKRELVTRTEFKGLGLTAAHTTQYGWCAHDFASEPCQMYRDCINCEEQECIKGEAQKEANLRMLKSETEYLLKQAREALSEEEYGADTWVKHQTLTLERVTALLSILEDPAVPVGTRIRLDVSNAPLITRDNVHPVRFSPPARRKALV
ncbi:integrase [Ralstonia holmesii]|uniref:integrase n=1 Tax=Ralstonia holmesii TaxID=3058602 RepID=UPI00292D4B77|nr:integrase [Ralstonia sp. LMG 32967]